MDRMEILRLALASTKDPREALTLAREMADFVTSGETPTQVRRDINPHAIIFPRRLWTDQERLEVAAMLDAGKGLVEISAAFNRSPKSIFEQIRLRMIPCKDSTERFAKDLWARYSAECKNMGKTL